MERIKEVRTALGMSQDEFAGILNLSRNFVWMLEKGEREPSDRTIADICRIYHVNEHWLRTGEGEMFLEKTREVVIAEIVENLYRRGDKFQIKLVELIANMTPDQVKQFKDAAIELAAAVIESDKESSETSETVRYTNNDTDTEVDL